MIARGPAEGVAVVLLLAALAAPPAAMADPTANRISGVAEFLLDRANDNFVYILQRRIRDNQMMQCFFPETYANATANNLRLILQAGPSVWNRSVVSDLDNLGAHLLYSGIDEARLRDWLAQVRDAYILAGQQMVIEHEGSEYRLDFIPLDADPEVRAAINGFYASYFDAEQEIARLLQHARTAQENPCPTSHYVPVAEVFDRMHVAYRQFEAQLGAEHANIRWDGESAIREHVLTSLGSSIAELADVSDRVAYYVAALDELRSVGDPSLRTMQLDRIIRESIDAGDSPFVTSGTRREYERFSSYAISFAMLTTADSPDQVKSVMSQMTVPPVSFGSKREPGAGRLMISAYFGALAGSESVNGERESFAGLSVPVGLEYSRALGGGSLSVMLAPFDFAHPVNQVIHDSEASASLRDIVNPGVYVSYGLRDLPIVIGVAYTRGRALSAGRDENVERLSVFASLELPLFNIW